MSNLQHIRKGGVEKMKRLAIPCMLIICLLGSAAVASAVKYKKVKSFKDVGQNRAFMIAITEEVAPDKLEDALWEIVNTQMEKYGQAPQMWIYFFDSKKYTPKKFPIEGQALDHLVATYFYATDTRKKDLKILTPEDRDKLKQAQKIDSPMWKGQ